MSETSLRIEIEDFRKNLKKDLIFKLLCENCSLSKAQMESLLIEYITSNLDEKLKLEEKARLRKKKVTKGAYLRTLKQAYKNIKESFYTILLLSYLGILSTPKFSYFIDLGEKLREYMEIYKDNRNEEYLKEIRNEIIDFLNKLKY
ncbi:MAG: hypothetical protein QXV60_01930 [Nitrososphaerota archaeon]